MKIMLVGDVHGDIKNVQHKVEQAKRVGGIQRIVILGDVGIWWRFEGVKFLDDMNTLAKDNNIQIFGVGGNHECWEFWDHMIAGAQAAKATSKGWCYVRSNVLLAPKVLVFSWGGKQFVVAGGAVSIDKDYRLQYERDTGKRIWSKNEQLTDAQVDEILSTRFAAKYGVKVDYLLTHDCSNMTPWKNSLKPDFESQVHRQRIDRVLRGIQPAAHFHGHYHTRYEWENLVGDDAYTSTYGLECNRDIDSWGILDLSDDSFVFASDM